MGFELVNKFYEKIEDILTPLNFVRKGKKCKIAEASCAFDIEVSSFYVDNEKQACMYCFVFGINGKCVRGRTWEEFKDIILKVSQYYDLSVDKRLIVYVHNLAYEFQFIRKHFTWYETFNLDTRKVIYAITNSGIEFRCSYILSNSSLEIIGKNLLKYKVEKKVGDLDYNKLRTPITPLTETEWGYVLNDGLVVMAYIQEEIERMGGIKNLPLTSTGYVRLLCKSKCFDNKYKFIYPKLMKCLTLEINDYELLKRGYSGGFTHANYNYVGKTLSNVSSYDFTSSYPSVMLAEEYPMSRPMHTEIKSINELLKYLKMYCCIFDICFKNIKAKVNFEHYISSSRCDILEHYILDNGRVVEASTLATTIVDKDFLIILEMYEWEEMRISNFTYFHKAFLPKPIITTIIELYKKKTELKGVAGKEAEYMESKALINSIYGMCVTDICRDEDMYDNENEWYTKPVNISDTIDKYNTNRARFLYYPWGVWVSAYARYNLFKGILEFKDDYIYSDTDSIKVLNREKHLKFIDDYNKEVTKKIKNCYKYYGVTYKVFKTIKGVEKPLGVWDYEGTYLEFKTLGAKRYMYNDNNDLHITIAGVSKSKGKEYLLWKYKTIERVFKNFKEDLHFPSEYAGGKSATGKLCHTYIDEEIVGDIIDYLGNMYHYKELSCIHMEPCDYTMSLNDLFLKLISGYNPSELYIR